MYVSVCYSGDYQLIVCNDVQTHCGYIIDSIHNVYSPVRTAQEVIDDINRYFHGEEPNIRIFRPALSNVHIVFAGVREKRQICEALISIAFIKSIKHESDLYDYCGLLGTRSMLKNIEEKINNNPTPLIAKRLKRMRDSIKGVLHN